MVTEEYAKAAVEALGILNTLEEEDYNKIPKSVIQFLEDNRNIDYNPEIDYLEDNEILKQQIMKKTKEILSGIYLEYLSSEEEKKEYLEIVKKKELEYQESIKDKYNIDDLFNKKKMN